MDTVRKKNISGVDLEVAVLDNAIVAAGDEVDLPVNYAWHTDEEPAPVVYPDTIWADVGTPKPKANTSGTKE